MSCKKLRKISNIQKSEVKKMEEIKETKESKEMKEKMTKKRLLIIMTIIITFVISVIIARILVLLSWQFEIEIFGIDLGILSVVPLLIGIYMAWAIDYGKKIWQYQHGDNIFEVRNRAALAELYVNNQLQDSSKRLFGLVELKGKLESGEEIKASLADTFVAQPTLLVDDKLLDPIKK
jgi:hypothetical protein